VAGQVIDEWDADLPLPTVKLDSTSSTRREIRGVALRPATKIRIEGRPEGGEPADLITSRSCRTARFGANAKPLAVGPVDRRKRLSHFAVEGFAGKWGRRFRLPTALNGAATGASGPPQQHSLAPPSSHFGVNVESTANRL